MPRYIAVLFFIPLLLSCAGPVTSGPLGTRQEVSREDAYTKELAFRAMVEDKDRIYNIAYNILSTNAEFCGARVEPEHGLTAWNIDTVSDAWKRPAQSVYNLQPRLAVQHVADASPAGRAGMRSGDFIISINGKDIPPGKDALKIAAKAADETKYAPATFVLERNGARQTYILTPLKACAHRVVYDFLSNEVNAQTDGEIILIDKGIVRFAQSDDELALVIGHELGHITMGHIDKKKRNAFLGTLGGLAVDAILAAGGVHSGGDFSQLGYGLGAQTYSVAFEQEADYVGMYYTARAGFNTSNVANFWRRMAAEYPKSGGVQTHPHSPDRYVAIEHAHQEIIGKIARKEKLVPNMREEKR